VVSWWWLILVEKLKQSVEGMKSGRSSVRFFGSDSSLDQGLPELGSETARCLQKLQKQPTILLQDGGVDVSEECSKSILQKSAKGLTAISAADWDSWKRNTEVRIYNSVDLMFSSAM
jgi:hypothetical protein